MQLSSVDRNTLIALEEPLRRAETRSDRAMMDRKFIADFVEFGRSGRRYERDEMLFDHTDHAEINAEHPLPDYTVELVSADVALATRTRKVRYVTDNEVGRLSSLWVKVALSWRIRFRQGTTC